MVWIRMFATGIGHETPAMLAIVCAFMAGSAAGAWALDRRIAAARRPLRFYAALEFIIGGWAIATVLLLPAANNMAIRLIGISPNSFTHWLIAFLLPCLVLLPSTMAMGATFPAMERVISALRTHRQGVGFVYACNTFGAVIGVVGSSFIVAPRIGFSNTVFVFAALNIACGIIALLLGEGEARQDKAKVEGGNIPLSKARLLVTLFITGAAGIGFEAAATRVLAQVLENTIYTFAAVLSVYLLGTATGAAIYQRFLRALGPGLLPALLGITAASCALGILALGNAQHLNENLRQSGAGMFLVWSAEAIVAAAVFGLATISMGALFSHLVQCFKAKQGRVGIAVGVNTFGAALAPALFGVLLLALVGSKWTLISCSLLYLVVIPRYCRIAVGSVACVVIVTMFIPASLHVVTVPIGGRIRDFREGTMASVAVVEDARGDRVLRVNNRFQMGGTAAADAEYRGAHLPLLLHPAPQKTLFLGLGTGITAGGALLHPKVKIDGVELVPEVLDVLPLFEPHNHSLHKQTNVRLHAADARRFIRATTNRYDVIVADLFHPARDGAGSLYTIEHFRAMRDRLAPGGLVCQWLPIHQLDTETLAVITRTFHQAFASTEGFLLRLNVDIPVLGLIGRTVPAPYSDSLVEDRLAAAPLLAEALKRISLADSLRLLGQFVDVTPLIAQPGPTNTDDLPFVTFRAPRVAYGDAAAPHILLTALMTESLPPLKAAAGFDGKLKAFIRARNVYLNGLIADGEGQYDTALQRYVESARISPDFTAGYAQCLTTATVLAKTEPARARALLEALIAAQPTRPIARQMLERLQVGSQ